MVAPTASTRQLTAIYCSRHANTNSLSASNNRQQRQRAAMALGSSRRRPAQLYARDDATARETDRAAQYDREAPPRHLVWLHGMRLLPGAFVGEQRPWFNCALADTDSRLYALSTVDTEREAIKWEREGCPRKIHVHVRSTVSSRNRLPRQAMKTSLTRLPCSVWTSTVGDRAASTPGRADRQRCLPLGLLDHTGPRQQAAPSSTLAHSFRGR